MCIGSVDLRLRSTIVINNSLHLHTHELTHLHTCTHTYTHSCRKPLVDEYWQSVPMHTSGYGQHYTAILQSRPGLSNATRCRRLFRWLGLDLLGSPRSIPPPPPPSHCTKESDNLLQAYDSSDYHKERSVLENYSEIIHVDYLCIFIVLDPVPVYIGKTPLGHVHGQLSCLSPCIATSIATRGRRAPAYFR